MWRRVFIGKNFYLYTVNACNCIFDKKAPAFTIDNIDHGSLVNAF